jgi:hypothetical protein
VVARHPLTDAAQEVHVTRYAIDAAVALRLVEAGFVPADDDQLVGPAVLRSDVLEQLFADVREGRRRDREARALLDGLAAQRIRLLGDRVSRATAWRVATELGSARIRPAEYVAVALLQADVLVTDDPLLAADAGRYVATAPSSVLLGGR